MATGRGAPLDHRQDRPAQLGFIVVGLFVVWAVAVAYWRLEHAGMPAPVSPESD
jgi:hypothetical protein